MKTPELFRAIIEILQGNQFHTLFYILSFPLDEKPFLSGSRVRIFKKRLRPITIKEAFYKRFFDHVYLSGRGLPGAIISTFYPINKSQIESRLIGLKHNKTSFHYQH